MGSTRGTIVLIVALVTVFGIEVVSHTMGDESALLKLGALPTDGQLHAEYWRLLTYSFLHLNPLHLLLNVVALWWTGRIVERRLGTLRAATIYSASVILSGSAILQQCAQHSQRSSQPWNTSLQSSFRSSNTEE